MGIDLEPRSAENLAAAGLSEVVDVHTGDATATPFGARSFDVILCDPPYGERMGSHDTTMTLYLSMLDEAARLAWPGTRFVVISHELKRMEKVLRDQRQWKVAETHQVFQKGHNPKIWLLRPA